jgi:hypothetical protein
MTTPFTKASDIANYLTTLIQTIKVVNGFNSDIGLTVFRGRKKIDDDMVPCAVILEGEDRPGDNVGREEIKITQSYVLGGYVKCDPDNPNDAAHMVIKDLKKVIFGQGPRMGGRVRAVSYAGRDIGPRADGLPIVFAVIHIDIEFAETSANA